MRPPNGSGPPDHGGPRSDPAGEGGGLVAGGLLEPAGPILAALDWEAEREALARRRLALAVANYLLDWARRQAQPRRRLG